jgi:hypothetical protein
MKELKRMTIHLVTDRTKRITRTASTEARIEVYVGYPMINEKQAWVIAVDNSGAEPQLTCTKCSGSPGLVHVQGLPGVSL